jgi:NAD(P)-dependent dehydrogenase (short-subunit alcohol dehydrogenase family)
MQNRVAMITGAAGALGSELAMISSVSGWETVLLDQNQHGLERLYDRIEKAGGPEPSMVVMDLVSMGPQDCQEIADALESKPGRLDALIHCAVSFEGLQPLEQIQPQNWLRQMQINLNAPWLLSTTCLPLLRKSRQASLYFLGEDLNKMSAAYWGAYGVSKYGVTALAEQFAAELANSNVQVLALNPGPMRSPLRAKAYHTENPGEVKAPLLAAQKILRLMERSLDAKACQVSLNNIDA